mmetsp:Transcript_25211/g.47162  ORF Transcript_25211/g.47162 Transcript_25211/m.47162 type:complete len:373 (+) Transcript_25211:79-1197(+)
MNIFTSLLKPSAALGNDEQSSQAATTTSYTTPIEWQRRIYSLQSERCTPEARQQYQRREQAKQARKKRIETSCKSASRLEKANYLSSASNMCTLQTFSSPAPQGASMNDVYEQATPKTFSRARKIQQSCHRRAVEDEEDNDDDLDEVTNEVMQDMVFASPALMSSVGAFGTMSTSQRAEATSTINSELLTLLKQLEVEPSEDSELTAKFALFETFLETVTVIREQTLAFWNENKDLFEGGSGVAAQKEVDKIDSEDAMGIMDDPRRWFVYAMTKKANENSGKIAQTLALLRSRLEQINNDDVGECPFCLEDMGPMKESQQTIVLSCCHRVCRPCWEQWQAVKGARAFCPLCRSDEFVAEVLSSPMAGGGGGV